MAQDRGGRHEYAYPPIRDYGLIGDRHGAALVGRNGSVDWCCLGRLDSDPVFCRIRRKFNIQQALDGVFRDPERLRHARMRPMARSAAVNAGDIGSS